MIEADVTLRVNGSERRLTVDTRTTVLDALRGRVETPGMFALESAIDEMAIACGIDPVEFRLRNLPSVEPESGLPFSSHGLAACLREGARRFGWQGRDPRPRMRRQGR